MSFKYESEPGDGPVFEEQGPEDTRPVLSSDLIRDDHCLHNQMGNAGQSVLLQVQKDGTWGTKAERKLVLVLHLHGCHFSCALKPRFWEPLLCCTPYHV